MEILKISNVCKTFEEKKVLDIDEIILKKGSIYGFLGKNGAGKSTTINIVMGLEFADSGSVYFEDKMIGISDLEYKKKVGYCPDYPAIFPKLTVVEQLYFIATLYNVSDKTEVDKRIKYYLKHFQLEKYENMLLEELSRGNQQKVSIIASLLHNPKLLMYDEPTLGLDPISLRQFKDVLKRYVKDGGTVFLSSHSLDVVEEIADYIIVIEEGKIIRNNVKVENIRESLVSVEEYLLSTLGEEMVNE